MTERATKTIEGCIILATNDGTLVFPQKDVILCGEKGCAARSDHVGELPCRYIPKP